MEGSALSKIVEHLIERYVHLVLRRVRKSKVLIRKHTLTWTVVVQQLLYK